MSERSQRIDTMRKFSALGAGVLIAAISHCGGKSESSSDDSGGSHRGGASGSAGYSGSYGGVGAGAYGGNVGTGGVGPGAYGGAVGLGGAAPTCTSSTLCYEPAELTGCFPNVDAGLDGAVDGGPGAAGEGGAGGEASEPPPISIPRPADAGPGGGSGGASEPPPYPCPMQFPHCVPSPGFIEAQWTPFWNGAACCYPICSH